MKKEPSLGIFAKGAAAGIMIAIGGTVYLMSENKYIGGFLFSFGLFTIIQRGFALYTGKVGYIPERDIGYIKEVLLALAGNIVGTAAAAFLAVQTRIGGTLSANAAAVMSAKLSDNILSRIILGFFCGILMYLAVDNAAYCREKKADASMVFGTVVPVMVFIFSGFNHSIADCFYYFAAGADLNGAAYLAAVIVGNAAGGMTIPLLKKLF